MTKDNDMPDVIWALPHDADSGCVYSDVNFWGGTKYTRHDPDSITISRKELEGMRLPDHPDQSEDYQAGYNFMIDTLLNR